MSLIKTNLFNVSKTQYLFKLKSNLSFFVILILLQMAFILLGTNNVSCSSFASSNFSSDLLGFSCDSVIIITLIWAFIVSFSMTTKNNRYSDFTFASTRLSSSLSNIALLITIALYGSVTASLSGGLSKLITYLTSNKQTIISDGFALEPQYLLINIVGIIFYILLVSSIGYTIGSVMQVHWILILVIPIIPILTMYLAKNSSYAIWDICLDSIYKSIDFYRLEASLSIFIFKTFITSFFLLLGSILISKKLEVRK